MMSASASLLRYALEYCLQVFTVSLVGMASPAICFFIAVPAAIITNHFVGLTLFRILMFALLLTGPEIIFLDYQLYLSSGDDSGPPEGPYSLLHIIQSLSSVSDVLLMVVVPTSSAILCAATLWYLRFRKPRVPRI